MTAHTFNPSTRETKPGESLLVKDSLVYKVGTKLARST